MYNLWRFVALNDSKISFVAINAVLSRIFCRNLRAFVWRKFVQKIVCVEKKRQISGMNVLGYKLNYLWSDLSTSDILRYILCPAECIRYIAIYFVLPSDCDI